MASAKTLIQALAAEIGWTASAVEAYALELRRVGWWPKTKRGRGASSITVDDAAKLLLAVLSDGPKSLTSNENDGLAKFDGTGFFLRSANLGYMPADWNGEIYKAVCAELGLRDKAMFLDFITAFLSLFVECKADRLVRTVRKPVLHEWDYLGPDVSFAVSGPFPMATVEFYFSDGMVAKLLEAGLDREEVVGRQSFVFLHQMFTWHHEAKERGDSADVYEKLILGVGEFSAKGLRYEKGFGGRELSACADVLRAEATD